MAVTRVEVTPKQGEGMRDVRGDVVRRQLMADHNIKVEEVRSINGFLIKSNLNSEKIEKTVYDLFSDPIMRTGLANLSLSRLNIFPITPDAASQSDSNQA